MDCLTKTEARAEIEYVPEDAKFCPFCLTQLVMVDADNEDSEGKITVIKLFYCPNESCLNDAQYDQYGNSFS